MSRARVCVVVGVLVALWSAGGVFARATTGARTTADEPQYLMTAASLAADRDLDVANQRAAGSYRPYHEVGLPLQEEIADDGSRISPHDPLLPVLLAVPMALGGWVGAKVFLALIAGALAAAMLFVAEARLGVRRTLAVPVVLAASLAAPLAIHATQVYPEVVAALVVTLAVAVLTAPRSTARHAVAVAALVTALPWLSVKYAPVAGALVVVAAVRGSLRSRLVLGGLLGASAIAFAVLHLRWYGGLTPYAVGRHFTAGQLDVMGTPDLLGRSTRLVGLFVDRDFGLLVWQPLYAVALLGFVDLVRRRSHFAVILGLPALAGWLNATFVALTMHGWWFPGRQVVVVLPCLVLAGAWWCEQHASARVHAAVRASAVLGASLAGWLVVQVVVTDTRLVTTFAELGHPWWRVARLAFPDLRADRPLDALLLFAWSASALFVIVRSSVSTSRLRRRALAPF